MKIFKLKSKIYAKSEIDSISVGDLILDSNAYKGTIVSIRNPSSDISLVNRKLKKFLYTENDMILVLEYKNEYTLVSI